MPNTESVASSLAIATNLLGGVCKTVVYRIYISIAHIQYLSYDATFVVTTCEIDVKFYITT